MQKFDEILGQARESMTVKRVFGDPYEHNGVTLIPAAKIRGGAGGGAGHGPDEKSSGFGGGYGVMASPAGTYVIRGETVTWVPAIDVNRAILIGGVIAIFFLGTIRSVVKTLAKR
jgi:uncharacterized spore protein YtfJ